jgi:hypothetical protein
MWNIQSKYYGSEALSVSIEMGYIAPYRWKQHLSAPEKRYRKISGLPL